MNNLEWLKGLPDWEAYEKYEERHNSLCSRNHSTEAEDVKDFLNWLSLEHTEYPVLTSEEIRAVGIILDNGYKYLDGVHILTVSSDRNSISLVRIEEAYIILEKALWLSNKAIDLEELLKNQKEG